MVFGIITLIQETNTGTMTMRMKMLQNFVTCAFYGKRSLQDLICFKPWVHAVRRKLDAMNENVLSFKRRGRRDVRPDRQVESVDTMLHHEELSSKPNRTFRSEVAAEVDESIAVEF